MMPLFASPTSPFVRKVMVMIHEAGLSEQILVQNVTVNPLGAANEALIAANPLGKIPCLVTPDHGPLFDSRVICEYMDHLHSGDRWFPTGEDRFPVAALHALSDGIGDAMVLIIYENRLRSETTRLPAFIEAQMDKVRRGLSGIESKLALLQRGQHIAQIAVACMLEWFDFRFPEFDWRKDAPGTSEFLAKFRQRDSMQRTLLQTLPSS